MDFVNQPVNTVEDTTPWRPPSPRKTGMICLIMTESALFSIFVVAFVFYLGKSLNGPFPSQILHPPWLASAALIGSSFTIMGAEFCLKRNNRVGFNTWWLITIALGAYFLYFTGTEWYELIFDKHFTISSNIAGSTFYSLVGLHASHVVVGLCMLTVVVVSSLRGKIDHEHHEHVEMISWYWHFVDWVWVIVFTLVYIISPQYGPKI
ncbi:MAG TPA: cytochrome c oxidase subunit 3 [Chthoniobacterales bacterium]|jgi:cytochrome c oxidase subunit 3/cytochrome o ubiquinol oxidase subunit 3